MTDLRWFLLCVFGFILLITGFSLWEYAYVPYENCSPYNCYTYPCPDCTDSYMNARIQSVAGIVLMALGPLLVVISCPIVTHRLNLRANAEAPTQQVLTPSSLTQPVRTANIDYSAATLRDQFNARDAQIQNLTERLGQMEKGQQSRPLGSEVENYK